MANFQRCFRCEDAPPTRVLSAKGLVDEVWLCRECSMAVSKDLTALTYDVVVQDVGTYGARYWRHVRDH